MQATRGTYLIQREALTEGYGDEAYFVWSAREAWAVERALTRFCAENGEWASWCTYRWDEAGNVYRPLEWPTFHTKQLNYVSLASTIASYFGVTFTVALTMITSIASTVELDSHKSELCSVRDAETVFLFILENGQQ